MLAELTVCILLKFIGYTICCALISRPNAKRFTVIGNPMTTLQTSNFTADNNEKQLRQSRFLSLRKCKRAARIFIFYFGVQHICICPTLKTTARARAKFSNPKKIIL
jgi:hypothetical protein